MPNYLPAFTRLSCSGYTLIEIVTVLTLTAILAAIAIPSYRQYYIRNAESQALAQIKQTELELESWRANTLSYKGFYPKHVTETTLYTYSDSPTNITINIPDDTANPKYTVTLSADSSGTISLTKNNHTTVANAWYMYATPSAQLQAYGAKAFLINSKGLACKGAIAINSNCKNAGEVIINKF